MMVVCAREHTNCYRGTGSHFESLNGAWAWSFYRLYILGLFYVLILAIGLGLFTDFGLFCSSSRVGDEFGSPAFTGKRLYVISFPPMDFEDILKICIEKHWTSYHSNKINLSFQVANFLNKKWSRSWN
jgi:hypothetical protein